MILCCCYFAFLVSGIYEIKQLCVRKEVNASILGLAGTRSNERTMKILDTWHTVA
jgi:hypothetical protein